MFGTQTRIKITPQRVEKAAEKGAYKSFMHAAASIRKEAIKSIRNKSRSGGGKPGPVGGPVRTKSGRGGGMARRSLLYSANKDGAVIGFVASRMDQAMEVHEHGGIRGGVQFPERPTMQPALQRNLARFHREWEGAI